LHYIQKYVVMADNDQCLCPLTEILYCPTLYTYVLCIISFLHTTSPKSCGLMSSSCKLNALLDVFSQVSLHLIMIQCSLQIMKLLIMQISAISISYKCKMCVFACVQVCHLIVLCKVQIFVSGVLTLLGQFPIMSFVADIKYQRWIAVVWENICREEMRT